jgi:putative SOS response-associated peptidase YedK
MCGRYALRTSLPELARRLGAAPPEDLAPRYNIAPTQPVLVLRAGDGARELGRMRWGLVPSWSRGPDSRYAMYNARIEGVADRPAYRSPMRRRRCLIPADGWFEWQAGAGGKQPWLLQRPDRAPFCFAGLWDRWEGGGEPIASCTILTAPAVPAIAEIHARMPVIAPAEAWEAWLDPAQVDPERALAVLTPGAPGQLEAVPVSRFVNDARHDEPRCTAPLSGD